MDHLYSRMLPRALILIVAVGLAAVAATGYDTGSYNDRTYGNNRYRNNQQPYNPTNNQETYQRYPSSGSGYDQQNYNQNRDGYNDRNSNYNNNRNYDNRNYDNRNYDANRDYNSQYNGYRDRSNVYTKNETAIFCYINGSRVGDYNGMASYAGVPLQIDDIDVKPCTHLIVGAASIHPGTYRMRIENEEFLRENELRRQNPTLKILVSISGRAETFAAMARSGTLRSGFISSINDFTKNRGFGVNIDWRWPSGKDRSDEIEDYFKFLKELKGGIRGTSLSAPGSSHDLSIFLPPEREQISTIFNGAESFGMHEYIDYYVLMALELRGHTWTYIEHHAPIDSYISAQTVRKAIDDVKSRVSRDLYYKFILAIPFYGKRYHLESSQTRSHESPMNKRFTKLHSAPEILTATYAQICQAMTNHDNQFGYDKTNESPYLVQQSVVYVYEDIESVRAKTRLALQNGFGGVMAYSIEMDDVNGQCSSSSGGRTQYDRNSYSSYRGSYESKFPLLHAIQDQVQRGNAALFYSSPLAIVLSVICALVLGVNN